MHIQKISLRSLNGVCEYKFGGVFAEYKHWIETSFDSSHWRFMRRRVYCFYFLYETSACDCVLKSRPYLLILLRLKYYLCFIASAEAKNESDV